MAESKELHISDQGRLEVRGGSLAADSHDDPQRRKNMNGKSYRDQQGDSRREERPSSRQSGNTQSISLGKLTGENLVDEANKLGKTLVDKHLKMNQIRRFLDALRRLEKEAELVAKIR